jgi:hypothetical protein
MRLAVGLFMAVGNRFGIFPTIPHAGTITPGIGSLLSAVARSRI